MAVDPRRVAAAIGEVNVELGRWQAAASETNLGAKRAQQDCDERIAQSWSRSSMLVNLTDDLVTASDAQVAEARTALLRAEQVREQVIETRFATQQLLAKAQKMSGHWNAQLQAALTWRNAAQQRVQNAQDWVAHAENGVRTAVSSLNTANVALERCMRDSERSDCRRQAAAADRATQVVDAAEKELQAANQELSLAQQDLISAQRRVECCEDAVHQADLGCGLAESASVFAKDALSESVKGVDSVRVGLERSEEAAETANESNSEASEAQNRSSGARETGEQARIDFDRSRRAFDVGAGHAAQARQDLARRAERLIAVDQPVSI